MTIAAFENLVDDFEFIDDWEERYKYVIELGKDMPEFAAEDHTEANKVHGCVSQVWIKTTIEADDDGRMIFSFTGDSDALIVRGLVAILRILFNGMTVEDVAATNAQARLSSLGLDEHLTPQRSNGLAAMIKRIQAEAAVSPA